MNNNIRKLIVGKADLSELNTLIKLGIIELEDAIKEVISMQDPQYIYYFAHL